MLLRRLLLLYGNNNTRCGSLQHIMRLYGWQNHPVYLISAA